jgi:hypothetical protein
MKTSIQILLLFSLLLFSDCRREKSWVISGRLLHSCDNPTPVFGHTLTISSSKSISNPKVETNREGRFELPYELDYRQHDNIFITDFSAHYVTGIPKKKNLDVGDVYLNDNYSAFLQLSVQRPTSSEDTVYYDFNGYRNGKKYFRKFKIGPFVDGQIIDSYVTHQEKIFDPTQFSTLNVSKRYDYKVNGIENRIIWKEMQECIEDTIILTID